MPTASAASTATVSSTPCVTASAIASPAEKTTTARARSRVISPAASGRNGLLTRSISTSSIWLIADDVDVDREPGHEHPPEVPQPLPQRQLRQRVGRDQVERDDADRGPDDRVRAREAPERAERARRGHGDGAAAHRRRRSDRTAPTGTNAAPASEPSTKRPANTSRRRQPIGAPHVLDGGGQRHRRLARRRLAPAHRDGVERARVAVPVRRHRGQLDVLEARALEPVAVLRLGREQHPQLGEPPQHAVPGRHRPGQHRDAAGLEHAVGLGDPALGRRPVLDRAGGDVAVEAVGRERQRLGVAELLAHAGEDRLALGPRELVRALVEHRHAVAVDRLDDPLGREARTSTGVQDLQPPLVEPRPAERIRPHGGRPEQGIDPAVVARREEAVEPVRLLLVLDQPHAPPVTVPSR